ncbi:MAG TPA: hypothetical protein VGK86_14535 [Thermoanaerobaculia bacterium]
MDRAAALVVFSIRVLAPAHPRRADIVALIAVNLFNVWYGYREHCRTQ